MDERKNEVNVRKSNKSSEVAKMFIKNDARTVADNIVYDHIIPGFMDMVIDGLHSTIDMFLGSGRSSRGRSYNSYYRESSRTSYNRMYRDDDRDRHSNRREETRRTSRGRYRIDEIEFVNKDRARETLDFMKSEIEDHGCVSVDQYYSEAIGREYKHDWAADRWGWESLRGVDILKMRGGDWVIDLPEPIKL